METASLAIHIAGGSLAVLAGYTAIFAAKGSDLHRRSGMIFVYAMIVMGAFASAVAAIRGIPGSLLAGLTVCYLVITAMSAVRPMGRRLDVAMCAFALATSALCFAAVAVGDPQARETLVPATILLLAGLSDVRILRGVVLTGPRRIARHLWRMCFAFFVTTGSFFLGQMDEFPVVLQKPALMAIPAMLPLVLMLYWLWRVRVRRKLAGLVLRPA